MRISLNNSAFVIVAASMLSVGCGKAHPTKASPAKKDGAASTATADADDVPITEADVEMPKSFADAVHRIAGYRDNIRAAIEAKTPSKAHRSLDALDIILGKLTEIARDGNVPKQDWETVNTAARELRDRFNEVHSAIDAKQEPDYQAVAKPIDAAIERLHEVAEQKTTNSDSAK